LVRCSAIVPAENYKIPAQQQAVAVRRNENEVVGGGGGSKTAWPQWYRNK